MRKVKKQSGFTLVEIAIVLVIIGLLLGGVLKGQELIESSKIKSLSKDLTSITTMFTSYQDRYNAVPGDDSVAATTYGTDRGWAGTFGAGATEANNGKIGVDATMDVMFNAPGIENYLAVQALRSAGFLAGDGKKAGLPSHSAGGLISFGNTAMGFGDDRNVVCFSGLTGKHAGALDRQMDDGVSNTGFIRSAVGAVAVTSTAVPYLDDTMGFVLCKAL